MVKPFVNKQEDGGQIRSTQNRFPLATQALGGGAGWAATGRVSTKKNHPPTLGSLKKERITIWKIIALQKRGKNRLQLQNQESPD